MLARFRSLLRPHPALPPAADELCRALGDLEQAFREDLAAALASGPADTVADRINFNTLGVLTDALSTHIRAASDAHVEARRDLSPHGRRDQVEAAKLAEIEAKEIGFDPRGKFVYILREKPDGWPIYVGLSQNVLARVGSHVRTKGVGHVSLVRCETRGEMHRMERQLIAHYRPVFNIYGVA